LDGVQLGSAGRIPARSYLDLPNRQTSLQIETRHPRLVRVARNLLERLNRLGPVRFRTNRGA
jgi:hypothetical protein